MQYGSLPILNGAAMYTIARALLGCLAAYEIVMWSRFLRRVLRGRRQRKAVQNTVMELHPLANSPQEAEAALPEVLELQRAAIDAFEDHWVQRYREAMARGVDPDTILLAMVAEAQAGEIPGREGASIDRQTAVRWRERMLKRLQEEGPAV